MYHMKQRMSDEWTFNVGVRTRRGFLTAPVRGGVDHELYIQSR